MCRKTIYDARNNFSALIKVAESGEPVELTRHDKPVAVIINWEEYKKKCIAGKSFIDKLIELRTEYADVFKDPNWEGFNPHDDGYPDDEYERKMKKLWG